MTKMTFNRFDDVNHLPLRVFNRVVYATSLTQDYGAVIAQQYLDSFSEAEKRQIAMVAFLIKEKGLEAARKIATNGLVIVDDETV